MNRFFRPSLSDSCPKNSAPMTSPIRYQVAMSATEPADMCKVLLWVRSGPTAAAIVISRPSRIQATPSAITSLVWNRDHGSRSIRAGIRLRIAGLLTVSGDADIPPSSRFTHAAQAAQSAVYPRIRQQSSPAGAISQHAAEVGLRGLRLPDVEVRPGRYPGACGHPRRCCGARSGSGWPTSPGRSWSPRASPPGQAPGDRDNGKKKIRRRRRSSAGRGRGHRVLSTHRADGGTARRDAAA